MTFGGRWPGLSYGLLPMETADCVGVVRVVDVSLGGVGVSLVGGLEAVASGMPVCLEDRRPWVMVCWDRSLFGSSNRGLCNCTQIVPAWLV